MTDRGERECNRVRDFFATWHYRWTLIKIAFLGSGEQCHAGIHAAIEAYHDDGHDEACCCWQHRGVDDAEPYSDGGPEARGFLSGGAGQWAQETRRDRTRFGERDASPETIRMGVARGERPLPGVRLPFPVELIPNHTTADERDAWFMPEGVIGSLALQVACPLCSVTMTHPCIGANENAVLVICDNRECEYVWSIKSFADAFPTSSRR